MMLTDSGGVAAQPSASEHVRPDATSLPSASEHVRSDATSLPSASEHVRSDATSLPSASEHVRPDASYATAAGLDCSPVTPPPPPGHIQPPITDPPAPGHDDPPVTHPSAPTDGLYDRTFTTDEVQRLVQAATASVLDNEVRLLQGLIRRAAAIGFDPLPPHAQPSAAPTVRQQQRAALFEKLTVVSRAVSVLLRAVKAQQELADDPEPPLFRLLDEAAQFIEDQPPPDAPPPPEFPPVRNRQPQ